jgi:hypothetical protein
MTEQLQLPFEDWRPVVGYEQLYEISSHGCIRRILDYRGHCGMLHPCLDDYGYLRVRLSKENHARTHQVHRLVLAAFVGPAPIEHCANHRDGSKTNNRVENLEYVTQKQNVHHAMKMGLFYCNPKGEKHPSARLTDRQVEEIRELAEASMTHGVIARRFGVSRGYICRVVNRTRR